MQKHHIHNGDNIFLKFYEHKAVDEYLQKVESTSL